MLRNINLWGVFLFLPFLLMTIPSPPRQFVIITVAATSPLNASSSQHYPSHHVSECNALLQFSSSFTNTKDASDEFYCTNYYSITSYPKTASWKKGTDCCSWDGVTCHGGTNYVIGLDLSCSWLQGPLSTNSTLFSLSNLQLLNLAFNDFSDSPISPRFGLFTRIAHLDLSYSGFSGSIPLESISHLSSLITLNFSSNYVLSIDNDHSFRRLVSNLTQLRELGLDGVDMSRISHVSLSNLSSTLTSLSLLDCNLQGVFPINIFHVPRLRNLQLSQNHDLTGTLPLTNWTSPLVSLYVWDTKFHGPIPACMGNLTSMENLDLRLSEFTGSVPSSLGNLERLTNLALGGNNLSTVDFEMFAKLKDLESLWISRNLSVLLPNNGNCSLPRLKWLYLSGCNLISTFPYFLNSSVPLEELDLSSNKITGEIPSSICQLSSLRYVDISDNGFGGSIPRCLGNFTRLHRLNVSYNGINDTFPHWLLNTTKGLLYLDLQSNEFHGVITEIPFPPQLSVLSLSDNHFEGPVPIPTPYLWYYSISNNKFSGEIPNRFCNTTIWLEVLTLSNNSLTGSIPHCFIKFMVTLFALDLRANKFTGAIPDIFVPGNLMTIRLSQNRLEGTLPRSLAYCENLEILDLRENELRDSFPSWLDTLPNLQVLDLRSNKFHGPIDGPSKTDHPFPKLRIFDISNNSFSGALPAKYIANLIAMKNVDGSSLQYMGLPGDASASRYYQDSIAVVMKGMEIELEKILTLFTSIDFSRNFFDGDIPELIGDLKALKGLNFSHNNLTGRIPSSVGNLTNLEWLDLSSNKLTGEIPRGLADLSSLSFLSLSDNQLMGSIPRGSQFDTFDHPFDGNPGLCGHPLSKECGTDMKQSPPSTAHEEQAGHCIELRVVAMGYGCGLAFGISAGYILLEIGRPRWLARMVQRWLVRMVERKRRRKTSKPEKNTAPRDHTRGTK